jgi:hypothetical protein
MFFSAEHAPLTKSCAEEALAIGREIGDGEVVAKSLSYLGLVLLGGVCERRPRKGHPVGWAEAVVAVAGEAARKSNVHDRRAGESDDPPRGATTEPDGARERGDQQHLGDHARQRPGMDRPYGRPGARGHADRRPRSRVLCRHVE